MSYLLPKLTLNGSGETSPPEVDARRGWWFVRDDPSAYICYYREARAGIGSRTAPPACLPLRRLGTPKLASERVEVPELEC